MEPYEKNKLIYRRQYILSPIPIDCNFLFKRYPLTDKITIFSHIDLNVSLISIQDVKLALLGEIFDYEHTSKSNEEILHDVIDADFSVVLEKISRYAGRYVIIHCHHEMISIVTDAAASRKVYYCRVNGEVYCASQPHLLAATLNMEYTMDCSKLQFYNSREFKFLNNSNIGNTTIYDDIFQLMPNHYLAYGTCKTIRFWPNQIINKLPLNEVVEMSTEMIKGYVKSITSRFKIMLPVTGGKDSRLLFAATKNLKAEAYYYINRETGMTDNSYDISIPKSLLANLDTDFHIIDPYIGIDEDFRKVYYQNIPNASESYLPLIYNYYVNFSDRINLPGIFVNIVEDVFEVHGKKISARVLAEMIHVEEFSYAEPYFASWLEGCQSLCAQYNLNVLNLLYWEERVANWGTQIQLNKDIAQEEFIPYNSRLLMQTMLSADLKYREKPDFIIFREIIRKLYPEALQAPFNPDVKSDVLKISKTLGIMKLVKMIYYRFFHRR